MSDPSLERYPGFQARTAILEYKDQIDEDQLRVLALKPSTDIHGDIECVLTTWPRKNCLPYTALSYCWGKAEPTSTINVNGQSFKIREELSSALHHLRLPDGERFLWVDAICIDQNNDVEKSRQV